MAMAGLVDGWNINLTRVSQTEMNKREILFWIRSTLKVYNLSSMWLTRMMNSTTIENHTMELG